MRPASAPLALRDNPDEEPQEEAIEVLTQKAPPWLISAVFHMVLLVIMGLITYQVLKQDDEKPTLKVTPVEPDVWAEVLGDQALNELAQIKTDQKDKEMKLSDSPLPPVPDPFAAPPEVTEAVEGVHTSSDIKAPDVGMALTGRQRGRRHSLMAAYGGNKLTEQAVLRALRWLVRQQKSDGSWSMCGPYSSAADKGRENTVAATAMALLAFQGHGDTHDKAGEFQKNVIEGWKYLIKQLDAQGSFADESLGHQRLYTQAQAMIALCESYGMTQDPQFKEKAQLTVDYAAKIQDKAGGWRYFPGDDSDLSVSGWFMMGLQSARMAKLNVPDATLKNLTRFLDSVAVEGGSQYRYRDGAQINPAMSAEGLLCRQYLGWPKNDERLQRGAQNLLAHPMAWTKDGRNVYYWYYATQVLHHLEGDVWRQWNNVMKQMLPERQIKQGKEDGSWDPEDDAWGPIAGRLYVTCLSTYMLEVYYRHLPIYAKPFTGLNKIDGEGP